jgi:hypothetical protein
MASTEPIQPSVSADIACINANDDSTLLLLASGPPNAPRSFIARAGSICLATRSLPISCNSARRFAANSGGSAVSAAAAGRVVIAGSANGGPF